MLGRSCIAALPFVHRYRFSSRSQKCELPSEPSPSDFRTSQRPGKALCERFCLSIVVRKFANHCGFGLSRLVPRQPSIENPKLPWLVDCKWSKTSIGIGRTTTLAASRLSVAWLSPETTC
jgi:hypothetical protein